MAMRSGYIKAPRRRNASGFWRETVIDTSQRRRGRETHEGVSADRETGGDLLTKRDLGGRDALGCWDEADAICGNTG